MPRRYLRGEVGYCSKVSSKETIPRRFYMPITQAAKEPDLRLTPSTEKMQGAGSWEAPAEICLLWGRRCWWRKIFLPTYQKSGMTRTCFGFWLKEGGAHSSPCQNGGLARIYAILVHTVSPWGFGAPEARGDLSPPSTPQTSCFKAVALEREIADMEEIWFWGEQESSCASEVIPYPIYTQKGAGGIWFVQVSKERYGRSRLGSISNFILSRRIWRSSRRRTSNTGTPKKYRVT